MATGPTPQNIFGQGKIPYLFRCYRINDFTKPFPVLPDETGIYVFANLSRLDANFVIDPEVLYVGRTNSYKTRVTEEHEKWENARNLKATHICLLDETSEDRQVEIERDIYDKHKPPLNDKRP